MAENRYTLRIKELPANDRPRERLEKYGAEALSNAELLALLCRTGTSEYSVIALAEHILGKFGGLRGVATARAEELREIKGIGPAKSVEILAMVELGKRLAIASGGLDPIIRSPQDAADILMARLRDEKQEKFYGVFLNAKNMVIKTLQITVGVLDSSLITPREIFREGIACSSASVILAHNHPSGDPTPSQDDITVTKRLCSAGTAIGIEVLDHLIIGDNRWLSLKERGLM